MYIYDNWLFVISLLKILHKFACFSQVKVFVHSVKRISLRFSSSSRSTVYSSFTVFYLPQTTFPRMIRRTRSRWIFLKNSQSITIGYNNPYIYKKNSSNFRIVHEFISNFSISFQTFLFETFFEFSFVLIAR